MEESEDDFKPTAIYSTIEFQELYLDCRAFLAFVPQNDDERYRSSIDMCCNMFEHIRIINVEASNKEPGAVKCLQLLQSTFSLVVHDLAILTEAAPHTGTYMMDIKSKCTLQQGWGKLDGIKPTELVRFPDIFTFLFHTSANCYIRSQEFSMDTDETPEYVPQNSSRGNRAVIETAVSTVLCACSYAWSSFQMRCVCQMQTAAKEFMRMAADVYPSMKLFSTNPKESQNHSVILGLLAGRRPESAWVAERMATRMRSRYWTNAHLRFT
jgi:hypothetical protein